MNKRNRIVAVNPEQRLTRQTAHRIAEQRVAAQRVAEQGVNQTALNRSRQIKPFLKRSERIERARGSNQEEIEITNIHTDNIKQRIILRIFLKKQVSKTHFVNSTNA